MEYILLKAVEMTPIAFVGIVISSIVMLVLRKFQYRPIIILAFSIVCILNIGSSYRMYKDYGMTHFTWWMSITLTYLLYFFLLYILFTIIHKIKIILPDNIQKLKIFFASIFVLIAITACMVYYFNYSDAAHKKAVFARTQQAAEQGNADAQYALGLIYYGSWTVAGIQHMGAVEHSIDYRKAGEWFLKAAEQGYAPAQFQLGIMYERGNLPKDERKAEEWLLKAVEQEYAPAQFFLGLGYKKGDSFPTNWRKAEELLLKAAEQGHAPAQFHLGEMYDEDRYIRYTTPNYRSSLSGYMPPEASLAWYQKAAEQEYGPALNKLGEIYFMGLGVPRDRRKGCDLMRKAGGVILTFTRILAVNTDKKKGFYTRARVRNLYAKISTPFVAVVQIF